MRWLVGADCLWQVLQVQLSDVTKSHWEIVAHSPVVTDEAGCKHPAFWNTLEVMWPWSAWGIMIGLSLCVPCCGLPPQSTN